MGFVLKLFLLQASLVVYQCMSLVFMYLLFTTLVFHILCLSMKLRVLANKDISGHFWQQLSIAMQLGTLGYNCNVSMAYRGRGDRYLIIFDTQFHQKCCNFSYGQKARQLQKTAVQVCDGIFQTIESCLRPILV